MYLIFLFEVSTNLFFFFLVEKILIILNVNLIYKKKIKKKIYKREICIISESMKSKFLFTL